METMTKSWKINNTLFDVVKRQDEKGAYGIYTDQGYKLASVSEGYRLVKNAEFIMPFVERFGEDSFKKVSTIGNGKSVIYEIETGKDIEIEPGDVLRQRLLAVNSYDKTKAYKFILGAFRSYCFNGLYNGLAFSNVQRIHYGAFDIADPIAEVLKNYDDLSQYDHWRNMAKIELTTDDQDSFIQEFKAYETETETPFYAQSVRRNEDIRRIAGNYARYSFAPKEKNTVWGLYNRMNWSIAKAFKTGDQREYMKINGRLEASLMRHFNVN